VAYRQRATGGEKATSNLNEKQLFTSNEKGTSHARSIISNVAVQ